MEKAMVWHILGLEPTEDEKAIRRQYLSLLPEHHPEDDPEGFQRLREAYEEALRLAKSGSLGESEDTAKAESEAEETPADEIERWLDRVRALYPDPQTRRDAQRWRELLSEPICDGLDTALELRERLLLWLMDHHFLPCEIWRILDERLRLKAEREELLERFPGNFLDYIELQLKGETYGDYGSFELRDGHGEDAVDHYISAYFEINRRVNILEQSNAIRRLEQREEDTPGEDARREGREILTALGDLSAYKVYHPYEDGARLRLATELPELLESGEASRLTEELPERYPEDLFLLRICGNSLAALGRWEEARDCWQRMLEQEPESPIAHFGIARYYHHREDYDTSEEILRAHLSGLQGNAQMRYFFMVLQKDKYEWQKRRLDAHPEDEELFIETCWSLFHSDRFEETRELLETRSYTEGTSLYYDYVDMLGRILLEQEKYEESLSYLRLWEKALRELPDDGSEKYKKRRQTLGYQKFVIAECLFALAGREGYPKEETLAEAERYIREALEQEAEESMLYPYEDLLMRIYLKEEKAQECLELCGKRIEENGEYLPAYLIRQEAHELLRDAGGIVDDYYYIVERAPVYYRPYVLALRVYIAFEHWDPSQAILEKARENRLEHASIYYEELRMLRGMERSKERYAEIEEKCRRLAAYIAAHPDEGCAQEEDRISEDMVWFQLACSYGEQDRFQDAYELVNERITKGTELRGFYMLRANSLRILKRYDEALHFYEELRLQQPENGEIDFDIGLCYKEKGRDAYHTKGIEAFARAVAKNPREACYLYELAEAYRDRFVRYESVRDYEEACFYADELVRETDRAYAYVERGLIKRLRGHLDEAIEDLTHAVELGCGDDKSDAFRRYQIGDTYFLKRDTDKAEEIFRHVLETYGNIQSAPVYQLADVCGARGDWQQGLEVLLRYQDGYETSSFYQNKLAEFMISAGRAKDALAQYERMREAKLLKEEEYPWKLLEHAALTEPERFDAAVKRLWKQLQRASGMAVSLREMLRTFYDTGYMQEKLRAKAEFNQQIGEYFLYARRLKQAKQRLGTAWACYRALANEVPQKLCGDLALLYRLLGQGRAARYYAEKKLHRLLTENAVPGEIKAQVAEDMETEEYFLNSYECDNADRCKQLALTHLCRGNREKGQQYLDRVEREMLCLNCRHQVCSDALIARGYAAEFEGDISRALQYFKEAASVCPTDEEAVLGAMYAGKRL